MSKKASTLTIMVAIGIAAVVGGFFLAGGSQLEEAEAGKVNVRTRGKEKTEDMGAAEFVEKIRGLIAAKTASL